MGWFDEQAGRKMTADEARAFLTELSKKTGASVEESDIANLLGKNPEDVAGHMAALEGQYTQRGAPTEGRSFDSQSGNYDTYTGDVNASGRAALSASGRAPSMRDTAAWSTPRSWAAPSSQGGDAMRPAGPPMNYGGNAPTSTAGGVHVPGDPQATPYASSPRLSDAISSQPRQDIGPAPRPYQAFTEQYTAPQWDQQFSFDPSEMAQDRGYQSEVADTIKATDRSAAARGLSFTNQAREDLVARVGDLASRRVGEAYGRQRDTYGTNYGTFADNADRGRASFLDRSAIHNANETGRYNTERGNRMDNLAIDDSMWGRDRTTQQDSRNWDQTMWGRSDADRVFAANRSDTRFNQERANLTDSRAWDSDLWSRGRTSQLDAWGRDDTMWNRGRTDRNDQWGRGTDLWNMDRTGRQDEFDNNYRLSDLVLRNRPRPA